VNAEWLLIRVPLLVNNGAGWSGDGWKPMHVGFSCVTQSRGNALALVGYFDVTRVNFIEFSRCLRHSGDIVVCIAWWWFKDGQSDQ
jgi:hypothetical protein